MSYDARDMALAMVILSHAKKTITPALEDLRAQANENLRSRETVVAVSPVDGTELGHITRTNPEPVAAVDDRAVLMAHLQETNPDALYDAEFIPGSVQDEAVFEVLREHAPHLLESEPRIRDYELNALLKQTERDGKPAAPGIVLRKPTGTTNVYPSKHQAAAIEAVITSGRVSLNGVVVPAIEGRTDGAED